MKEGRICLACLSLICALSVAVSPVYASEGNGTLVLAFDVRAGHGYELKSLEPDYSASSLQEVDIKIVPLDDPDAGIIETEANEQGNLSVALKPGRYKILVQAAGKKGILEYDNGSQGYTVSAGEETLVPLYYNYPLRDVFADAPWRINPGERIPLLLEIKDADEDSYPLYAVRVYDDLNGRLVKTYDGELGLDGDSCLLSSGFKYINQDLWYRIVFLDTGNFTKDGNGDIKIHVVYDAAQLCDPLDLDSNSYITVHASGYGMPGFAGWYYGDTHYHTQYTYNTVEFGGPVNATRYAGKAMGLSWVTTTDHSFDLVDPPEDWAHVGGATSKWGSLKNEAALCSDQSFRVLAGEEISAYVPGMVSVCGPMYVHYLAYGISDYVTGGECGDATGSDHTAEEVVSLVNQQGGVGYVAHPYSPDYVFRTTWQNFSSDYAGLEVWNGEATNEYYELRLQQGLDKWVELLLSGRKVFIEAGSDAHGSFSSAFGKVRTCCYMGALTDGNVLNSLRNGKCFLTDGPAVGFEIGNATLGGTLKVPSHSSAQMRIRWNSTPEFGNLASIRVLRGNISAGAETEETVLHPSNYSGNKTLSINSTKNCYYRLEATTDSGRRAYTNPIWLEEQASQPTTTTTTVSSTSTTGVTSTSTSTTTSTSSSTVSSTSSSTTSTTSTTSSTTTTIRCSASVRRVLPSWAQPGTGFTVTLRMEIHNDSCSAVGIEEHYPDGWVASNVSHNGADIGWGLGWSLISESGLGSLNITYDLTPPETANGTYPFFGVVYAGESSYVEGNDSLTVAEVCALPGNYPPCSEVTLGEVIRFICSWAEGHAKLSDVIALLDSWAEDAGS